MPRHINIIYIYTFVVSLSLYLSSSLSLAIYIYVPRDCELLKCGVFALASSPPFVSAYLSRVVAMAMVPCPHGHRALEVKDVAVGMQVVYVSRENTLINTHITKAGVFEGTSGPCVATRHKHAALLNRLFVPQRQSSAPDEGAAVGATQTAAAAPAGESAVILPAVAPPAAAAAAAGMEVQDEQAEIEDADAFLRHSVVPWLKAMPCRKRRKFASCS